MDTTPTTDTTRKSFLTMPVIIALFVLLLLLVIFMYGKLRDTDIQSGQSVQITQDTNTTPEVTQDRTIVYSGNLAAAAASERLPAGFPQNIPVETASLEESLKVEYPEKNVTQYTVTYSSEKTVAEVKTSYESFFKKDGYAISSTPTDTGASTQLYGTKNSDDLGVIIETRDSSKTLVHVVYLDRK